MYFEAWHIRSHKYPMKSREILLFLTYNHRSLLLPQQLCYTPQDMYLSIVQPDHIKSHGYDPVNVVIGHLSANSYLE